MRNLMRKRIIRASSPVLLLGISGIIFMWQTNFLHSSLSSSATYRSTHERNPSDSTRRGTARIASVSPRYGSLRGGTHVKIVLETTGDFSEDFEEFRLDPGKLVCTFTGFSVLDKSQVVTFDRVRKNIWAVGCKTPARSCGDICSQPRKHIAMGTDNELFTQVDEPPLGGFQSWPTVTWVDIWRDLPNEFHLNRTRLNRGEPGQFMFTDFDFTQQHVGVQLTSGLTPLKGWLNLDQGPSYMYGEQNVLWMYTFGLRTFDDNSIDTLVVIHSLVYLNRGEYEGLFADAFRVLKPGGVFRISEDTPIAHCPCPRLMSHSSLADTKQTLEDAGFAVLESTPSTTASRDSSVLKVGHFSEATWTDSRASRRIFILEGIKHGDRNIVSKTSGSKNMFMGVWKMTYASTDPAAALTFAVKYLGASDWNIPPVSCEEERTGDSIKWLYFKHAPVCGGDTGLKHYGREGSHFHLHFVQLSAKPQGAFTVKMYEEFTSSMHNQLQVEDIFMNPRVTLVTNSLDTHITKFREDDIPHLLLRNPVGSYSLFVEIPTGVLIELLGSEVNQIMPSEWSRCGKSSEDASQMQVAPSNSLSSEHATTGEVIVKPKRFVYASSNPKLSAEFYARYFMGTVFTGADETIGSGSCFEAYTVRWSNIHPLAIPFELVWIRAERATAVIEQHEMENYLHKLHGNLSESSTVDWNHFLDFHSGVLFDDCDPILRKLKQDGVGFSVAPHACYDGNICSSIFVQDQLGNVYEAMCEDHSNDLLNMDSWPSWATCTEPSEQFTSRVQTVRAPPYKKHM